MASGPALLVDPKLWTHRRSGPSPAGTGSRRGAQGSWAGVCRNRTARSRCTAGPVPSGTLQRPRTRSVRQAPQGKPRNITARPEPPQLLQFGRKRQLWFPFKNTSSYKKAEKRNNRSRKLEMGGPCAARTWNELCLCGGWGRPCLRPSATPSAPPLGGLLARVLCPRGRSQVLLSGPRWTLGGQWWWSTPFGRMPRHSKRSGLTARLLLHELPLTVDDAEDEQGQQHGGQGAADDGRQGRVPRAGGRGWDPHQVDLAGTWKPRGQNSHVSTTQETWTRTLHVGSPAGAFVQHQWEPRSRGEEGRCAKRLTHSLHPGHGWNIALPPAALLSFHSNHVPPRHTRPQAHRTRPSARWGSVIVFCLPSTQQRRAQSKHLIFCKLESDSPQF